MSTKPMHGVIVGKVVVEFLPDGRLVKLVKDFGFIDKKKVRWDVPAGRSWRFDSARAMEFIGGPFEGQYRTASVIHDWYCDVRSRPWRSVHRVFYDIMRVCGVGEPLALVMYGGVYWGGPRWTETARTNVEHLLRSMQSSAEGGRRFHSPMDGVSHKPFDDFDLTRLSDGSCA